MSLRKLKQRPKLKLKNSKNKKLKSWLPKKNWQLKFLQEKRKLVIKPRRRRLFKNLSIRKQKKLKRLKIILKMIYKMILRQRVNPTVNNLKKRVKKRNLLRINLNQIMRKQLIT